MGLNKLSNQSLDSRLKALVSNEREILKEILLHIAEVDRRRMYLDFGYPSLFAYLTKSIGYAEGSAQRRIDAARLSFEAPLIIEKLETGELNLSQVSLLQKSIREVQACAKCKVDSEVKQQLIDEISNKSFSESEVIVSKALNISVKTHPKTMHQRDESVRLEVTLTKAQWQKLNKMRELLSNSLPDGGSWDQVLEYVADRMIQQRDKSRAMKKQSSNAVISEMGAQESGSSEVSSDRVNTNDFTKQKTKPAAKRKIRQPIPLATQRLVYQRDQCCQFQDSKSNRICGSKWHLHIDHIQPVWAGGSNELGNLRLLCASHNQQMYRHQTRTISGNRDPLPEVDRVYL